MVLGLHYYFSKYLLINSHTLKILMDYRNYYEGHMDKIKGEGGGGGGKWVRLGWGGGIKRKGVQL